MRILENIEVIFNPSTWMQYCRYSREWDIELNELLERETFSMPNNYERTMLGKFAVNTKDFRDLILEVRPSRKTMLKARRKYEKDIIKRIKESK